MSTQTEAKPQHTQHTPGNWNVENWDNLTLQWLKSEAGTKDRCLIAAAPDYHEAIRLVRETGGDTVGGFVRITHEAYMVLMDAFNKAEGQS